MLPRGFDVSAVFSVFKLWVLEGTPASALATSHPGSVAESFLNIGNAVVRRQDTLRARVQVIKPLVGDLGVAHKSSILVTCFRAPFERSVSFKRLRRDRSLSRESCAWSCGTLSRLFRGAEKSAVIILGGEAWMFKGCDGRVHDAGSLQSRDSCLPSFVCRLGCLLNIQPCCCLLVVVECAEIGGGGDLDDLREARLQDLLR